MNTRTIDVGEVIGKGIAALKYVQEHILTQANIESVRDALAKIETFGEDAKTMLLEAKAFVEQVLQDSGLGGQTRSLGLDNKLSKAGVLGTFMQVRSALGEQPKMIVAPELNEFKNRKYSKVVKEE